MKRALIIISQTQGLSDVHNDVAHVRSRPEQSTDAGRHRVLEDLERRALAAQTIPPTTALGRLLEQIGTAGTRNIASERSIHSSPKPRPRSWA